MSPDQESLSRLTLRQLRRRASGLGVPLYSRKTKAALVKEIGLYQAKEFSEKKLINTLDKKVSEKANDDLPINSISETKVVFLPKDPEWAYVFWEISESDRNRALEQGASRLCLRLVDVTGTNSSFPNPGTLREVTVDSHSTEWYLPIPMGDRDYVVELGYRIGFDWMSLALSSQARVPSFHPSDQILDQFVPFSLEASTKIDSLGSSASLIEERDSGLHERLYQSATTQSRKIKIGSEEFQDGGIRNKDLTESGSGLWASGRNESGVGAFFSKPRSFWLVADAELIVYGSTDPSAKLTIGGEIVPLASDGTFRLQVPFRDGIQNYLIEAIDSDGIEKRNITLNFERSTPEDNTNPNQKSESEWF